MDKIRIAAVSCESRFGDVLRNLETVERWAKELHGGGVDVACFPELCLSGYSLDDTIKDASGPVPGEVTGHLEHIARLYGMVIVAGLPELTTRGIYISQAVVTPERYEGSYRKIHLSPDEGAHFFPGKEAPLFDWRGFRFGIGLCYDAHFPELATTYALKGADLIFYASASPRPETAEEKMHRWLRYLPARAYDNTVYVAACNQSGRSDSGMTFHGVSIILDPKGVPMEQKFAEGECAAVTDIRRSDLDAFRSSVKGHFLKHRVPAVYEEITKKRDYR